MAIHPTGGYALVTVIDPAGPFVDGKVYRFNLATNAFDGASVTVGPNPDAIAIAPNGSYALVTNEADDDGAAGGPAGSLSVLTLDRREHHRHHPRPSARSPATAYADTTNSVEPEYAAITPDGSSASSPSRTRPMTRRWA